jgi:hypothetical protein
MATSGNHVSTIQGHYEVNGYQQITSAVAATALTVPDKTKFAMIQPTGQNIRWRDDATDPTTTVGMRVVANDVLIYSGDLNAFKYIQEAATAVLNITYYK